MQTCDHASYDETPLEAITQNALQDTGVETSAALVHRWQTAVAVFNKTLSPLVAKSVSKLFAMKTAFCHLLKVNNNGTTKYFYMLGKVACRVQALKATSAACQARAIVENSSTGPAENSFRNRSRLVDADGHPSNLAGEELLDPHRPGWARIQAICQAHPILRAHNDAMRLVEPCIKGLIHLALCFQVAGSNNDFQSSVWIEARQRLRVRVGQPPPEDILYSRVALLAFVSGDGNCLKRKILLRVLPSGRFFDSDEIIVYVSSLVGIGVEKFLDDVATEVVKGLLHRRLRVLVRAKWGTAENAVCDAGLIEVFHG